MRIRVSKRLGAVRNSQKQQSETAVRNKVSRSPLGLLLGVGGEAELRLRQRQCTRRDEGRGVCEGLRKGKGN